MNKKRDPISHFEQFREFLAAFIIGCLIIYGMFIRASNRPVSFMDEIGLMMILVLPALVIVPTNLYLIGYLRTKGWHVIAAGSALRLTLVTGIISFMVLTYGLINLITGGLSVIAQVRLVSPIASWLLLIGLMYLLWEVLQWVHMMEGKRMSEPTSKLKKHKHRR